MSQQTELPISHTNESCDVEALTLRFQPVDDGGGGGPSHSGDGPDALLGRLAHRLDVRVSAFGVGVGTGNQVVGGGE